MDETFLHTLDSTESSTEKSALIAAFLLRKYPEDFALVARRCVVLHWFDLSIVKALIQDTSFAADEADSVYERLASLPFIERVPWGLTFQDLTRRGLIELYAKTQPELLQQAAHLAAPAYLEHKQDKKIAAAESLFCYVVANESDRCRTLLDRLLNQAIEREDWRFIDTFFYLKEEAEQNSFVRPLPLSEQQQLLRRLVRALYTISSAETTSASDAPKRRNAYTCVSRGIKEAYQQHFKQAIIFYNKALRLDPTFTSAHVSRGIVSMQCEDYTQALYDFDGALLFDPKNTFLLQQKGTALSENWSHEEALAAYEEVIRLDPLAYDAYVGRGNALYGLERYVEALAVYEQAILLNPHIASAYTGKGNALSSLKRYVEAQLAYEQAQQFGVGPMGSDIVTYIPSHSEKQKTRLTKAGRTIKQQQQARMSKQVSFGERAGGFVAAIAAMAFVLVLLLPRLLNAGTGFSPTPTVTPIATPTATSTVTTTPTATSTPTPTPASQQGINFASFTDANAGNLQLNGSAEITSSVLRLTSLTPNVAGSAYYKQPIDPSQSFQTHFEFFLHDGTQSDGIAFIIQNTSLSALGGSGGNMGYGGISSSLEVEFDTFQNAGEPDSNHIGILLNQQGKATYQSPGPKSLSPTLNLYGSRLNTWINYNASSHTLGIYIDPGSTQPSSPILTANLNITSQFAFVGFTGATGSSAANQDILNWQFSAASPVITQGS